MPRDHALLIAAAIALSALSALAACDHTPAEPASRTSTSAGDAASTPVASAPALRATLPERPARSYVGSTRCGECHSKEENAWKHDWHRRALSIPTADTVAGNFGNVHFKGASSEASMRVAGGKRVMQTVGTDGVSAAFSVDWVIGGRRMQDAVHVFPDGRWQVLPVYFHVTGRGEWVDYTETKQGALGPQHPFFWANFRRMANRECMDCHVTGLTVRYDRGTQQWATHFAEPGVACESCHGPGSTHAESQSPKDIFHPGKAGRDEKLAVCAQCHGPRAPLFPLLDERERYRPGERYEDSYDPVVVLIGENISGDYFVDGRPKTSSFEYQALVQSRCFMQSDLSCLTCHTAPHAKNAASEIIEPKGATSRAQTLDASCAKCHAGIAQKSAEHSHHKSATCVSCHMPPTVSGVLDHFADHAIDVPNLDTTARHGVANACAACHEGKKTTPELATSYAAWWPNASKRTARRSRLADAFDTETKDKSRDALLAVIADDHEAPTLRGAAVMLLAQRFSGETQRAATPLLSNASPVLRLKAVTALGTARAQASREAIAPLLGDTSLPVVQAAAIALTSFGDARGVDTLDRLRRDPRFSHLVTGQHSLAIYEMQKNDFAAAIPLLESVLSSTPYHAEASVMLADALVRTSRRGEARQRLLEALRFDPQHKGAAQRLRAMDASPP